MCVYLYIHNKYTQYTHIYHVNKTFILDVINCLTALVGCLFLNKHNFVSHCISFDTTIDIHIPQAVLILS